MSVAVSVPARPPWGKLALALEIVAAYVRVRWCLRGQELPLVVAELRSPRLRRRASWASEDVTTGVRLGRAVARTLEPLPADTRCLVRSLVLTRLLACRGIESTLVIGVSAGPEFAAHAWVETAQVALLPTGGPAYERLVTL